MKDPEIMPVGNKNPASKACAATSRRVLLVTRDPLNREALLRALEEHGLEPLPVASVSESRRVLSKVVVSLVVCEETLADGGYREILRQVGGVTKRVPVVVFSSAADWDHYLEAMNSGAFDYLRYPCPPTEVESAIARALF